MLGLHLFNIEIIVGFLSKFYENELILLLFVLDQLFYARNVTITQNSHC